MMLLPQKSSKRQSFSIDSLAISSHVEDDTARDTDSPYLNYLEQVRNQSNGCNSNGNLQKQLPSLEPQIKCANFIFSHQAENQISFEKFGHTKYRQTLAPHSTSTPRETPCKRRRLCSTSTPPSSADDSNEDDKMALDSSIMTSDKLSPTSGSVASDHEGDSTCSDSSLRRKKLRTAFTGDQLRELEKRYKTQKYLTASDRTHLAKLLGLKDQQVKTWFQNRRMKEKRQQRDDDAAQGFCLPTGGVDIAQLAALGVYSPHIGAQLGSPNPINYHFNSPPSPMEPRIPSHPITGSSVSPVQHSPQIVKQGASLSDMYRSGQFLQSAQIAPHLMASPIHPAYPSAFTSLAQSRYSASPYHPQVLKASHQST